MSRTFVFLALFAAGLIFSPLDSEAQSSNEILLRLLEKDGAGRELKDAGEAEGRPSLERKSGGAGSVEQELSRCDERALDARETAATDEDDIAGAALREPAGATQAQAAQPTGDDESAGGADAPGERRRRRNERRELCDVAAPIPESHRMFDLGIRGLPEDLPGSGF